MKVIVYCTSWFKFHCITAILDTIKFIHGKKSFTKPCILH